MMKCIYSPAQKKHYPESFLVNGERQPNPETPQRVDLLLAGAQAAGMTVVEPADYGTEAIARVHSPEYLTFLAKAYARWERIPGAAKEITPNIHPIHRDLTYPASVVAQAGFHMLDASAPVTAETWESAIASAHSAIHAAETVLAGEDAAYALCRPPGHHAGADYAAGFCYLNNSAIAAEHLRQKYAKVAILDVDLHHGNGTQDIFYARNDVLTISLHADPVRFYPFFWGSANETGKGDGAGYNLNIPLPRGTRDDDFLTGLETALDRIEEFAPDAVVIALGLDAYEGDPIAGLAISTEGFGTIGHAIAQRIKAPMVLVQEGGYPCAELGDNLAQFMAGFSNT